MILNVPLLPFLIVSPKISFGSRNLFKFVRNYIVQFFCFALTFELVCVCIYIYSRKKYKKPVVTFEFSFMENLGELCRHVANISHARKEWRGAAYSGTYLLGRQGLNSTTWWQTIINYHRPRLSSCKTDIGRLSPSPSRWCPLSLNRVSIDQAWFGNHLTLRGSASFLRNYTMFTADAPIPRWVMASRTGETLSRILKAINQPRRNAMFRQREFVKRGCGEVINLKGEKENIVFL